MRRVINTQLSALLVLAAAVLLSACTSSAGAGKSTSAGASTPVSSPTAPSTPVASTTSASPSPTPSPTHATPLSPFEKDPGLQAYRAWAAEAGRTVNAGHDDSAALRKLMSAAFAKEMNIVLAPDAGTYYPGPLPFQPTAITVVNATQRKITGCMLTNGWAQNPKTHKPAHARQVRAVYVVSIVQSGRWILNYFYAAPGVSCTHVTVRTQRW